MKYLDRGIGEVICHSAIADANMALDSSGFTEVFLRYLTENLSLQAEVVKVGHWNRTEE